VVLALVEVFADERHPGIVDQTFVAIDAKGKRWTAG
jgi:hypothetical protein